MASDPHRLLMAFDEAHREHHDGWPYAIAKGKDHALAKDLLEHYTMEQLQKLVSHFFVMEDDFIAKAGHSFGIFKACLPKVLASYQRQQKVAAREQMIRDRQQREATQISEWRNMSPEEKQRVRDSLRPVKTEGC